MPYPRGRALGGSGAINAMAHVRGHRAVYDGWAAAGAAGWGFVDLLPYFRRSESAPGRDPALRGTEGPVRVTMSPAYRAPRKGAPRAAIVRSTGAMTSSPTRESAAASRTGAGQ